MMSNAAIRGRVISMQLREGEKLVISERDLEDLLAYITYLEDRSKDE